MEFGGEVEEEDGGVDEVLRVELVAGHHGVQAEALDALGLEHGVGLEELVAGETVLRLLGLADDGVAALEGAGVVAEADALGETGDLLEEGDVGDVVEVDVGAQLLGLHELLGRGVVGGEHDGVAGQTDALGEEQLGQGRAVGAEALLLQDAHEVGVGRGLDGEEVAETLVPGEGVAQAAGGGADGALIVEVEGGGPTVRDLADLGFAAGEVLFGHGVCSGLGGEGDFGGALPEGLDVVVGAGLGSEDVGHHGEGVEQHPAAVGVAGETVMGLLLALEVGHGGLLEGLEVGRGGAGGDHADIGDGGDAAHVEHADVFGLFVVEGLGDAQRQLFCRPLHGGFLHRW